MRKKTLILTGIITIALIFRIIYAFNIPLSGDESVSLLQSSGQAYGNEKVKTVEPTSIENLQRLIAYSENYGPVDVVNSMKYAGMHPPLYYLLLHYSMKFLGNGAFTLRLLSVTFSTLCIAVMYFLGKEIRDTQTGLISACLLAGAAYGVAHGSMVRPYPLVLLLSLFSTLQVFRLAKKPSLKFFQMDTILYAVTVTAGLYTIYNFIFIFIFQFAFLILCNIKNKKNLLVIAGMVLFSFLLYLPWLPSFFIQLKSASSGQFYFHGRTSLLLLADYVTSFNFTRQLPGRYVWYKFIIIAGVCITMFWGLSYLIKNRICRNLFLSLAIYLLFYYVTELLMGTNTLNNAKQLSFIIGISLLLAGIGISNIINRFKTVGIIFCIIFICVMFCNSVEICRNKTQYDGPDYMAVFPKKINAKVRPGQKTLVIANTFRRRYLLSLAHAIQQPVDIAVITSRRLEKKRPIPINMEEYDTVIVAELFKAQGGQLISKDSYTTALSSYFQSKGFFAAESYRLENEPGNELIIYYP